MQRPRLSSFATIVVAAVTTGYAYKRHGVVVSESSPATFANEVPSRATQLAALKGSSPASPFDILVIGGGATGCGVALDAQTRGLRTALVERDDFSAGTSSRSTKLVHGGVRYLERAVRRADLSQLRLVWEALSERATLLHNAPHLTTALPTMTPCYSLLDVPYYWAGLKLYDVIAGTRMLHMSRFYSAQEAQKLFPTLALHSPDGRSLKGAVVYYDGQMDDSRLNVALACTAAQAGAAVANHAAVTAVKRDEITGRACSARVKDTLTGKEFDVHAKVVVNATGPFVDSIRRLSNTSDSLEPMVAASTGVHVVLPDYFSPDQMGLIVPKTADGRVVFMLPWLGRTVAGTTDNKATVTDTPVPHEHEVAFILEAVNDYLSVKVRREDVLSAWSGIRPLAMDSGHSNTSDIVRDHAVFVGEDGMVTVTGGKWTTYRCMAQDAVDEAVRTGHLSTSRPCSTNKLKLVGARGWEPSLFAVLTQDYVLMKRKHGGRAVQGPMDTAAAKHLARAYGGRAEDVATIAEAEVLGRRLVHGYPDMEAEVVYCARHEYCETVVDFLARRSRLAFLDTAAAEKAIPRVAELLAAEHGWSSWRKRQEVKQALQFLETFRVSPSAEVERSVKRVL